MSDEQISGFMCGGIISETYYKNYVKEHGDPMGIMMSYIMPDVKLKQYDKLRKEGKEKEATKLFDEHSWSLI